MAVGRPTKLNAELIEKANGYLDSIDRTEEIPTREGLALYLGVSRDIIYDWNKLDTPLGIQFSYIFEKVMAEQGRILINGGIFKKFDSTITKLMLTKHGYVDHQRVDEKSEQSVTVVTRNYGEAGD